ncbi:hypothetical protein CRYUN_Cryun38cG0041100 [Craigia yunnanensis]
MSESLHSISTIMYFGFSENNSLFQSLIGPKGVYHKVAGQDVHPMLYLYCCFLPYFHENVPGPNYGVSECVKKQVADMWPSRAMYFTCRFAYLWTAKEIKSMYSSAEGIESCLLSAFKEQMTSATAVGLE